MTPRALRRWHRIAGLSAAVFVLALSVTGLMLNHTEDLSLDARYVSSDAVLNWYGINAPARVVAYPVGDRWLVQLDDRLYLGEAEAPGRYDPVLGAVLIEPMIVVATPDELVVFTEEGALVERLGPAASVPDGVDAIGRRGTAQLVLRTGSGLYGSDQAMLEWQPLGDDAGVEFSSAQSPPPALARRLQERYRGAGLSLERVVLDLHSGRFFGPTGVILVDAATVLLIVLAFSGLWVWIQRAKRAKRGQTPLITS